MDEIKKMGRPKESLMPKNRFTFYMTDEAHRKFNELYAFRIMTGAKDRKSDVLCEAVLLMHAKEFKKLGGRGKV